MDFKTCLLISDFLFLRPSRIALLASLVVALLLIPMLASRTGFKWQSGAGSGSHPLGHFDGTISLSTLVLRILLPMVGLLIVMVAAVCAGSYGMESWREHLDPGKKTSYTVLMVKVLWFWGLICIIPMVISLVKVRLNPHDPKGQQRAELWS